MGGGYQPIQRIHLISKTHLDIGFTKLSSEVVADYCDVYLPRVIAVNDRLREAGREERLVWTTGSWILNEALERADASARGVLERGIAMGDLAWHAMPFRSHTALFTPELLKAGLAISQRLDARFGHTTIAAKLTDVPGHTRALVPYLAEAGVELLHIGVNGGIHGPTVPPMFRWVDESSSSSVTVMYADDYGGFYAPSWRACRHAHRLHLRQRGTALIAERRGQAPGTAGAVPGCGRTGLHPGRVRAQEVREVVATPPVVDRGDRRLLDLRRRESPEPAEGLPPSRALVRRSPGRAGIREVRQPVDARRGAHLGAGHHHDDAGGRVDGSERPRGAACSRCL